MPFRTIPSVALFMLLVGCAAASKPDATAEPAAAAPVSVDWSKATRVDVVLESFAFRPDNLAFVRGRPYRLHLKNAADGGHNFDTKAFFRTVRLRADATGTAVKAAGGVIELPANGANNVYFVPSRSGRFPLECSHFLHASFGMEGEIVVR